MVPLVMITLGQNQSYQLHLHRSPNCSRICVATSPTAFWSAAFQLTSAMNAQALASHSLPVCRATSSEKIAGSRLPTPKPGPSSARRCAVLRAMVSAAVKATAVQEQLKENTLEDGLENHSTQGSHGVNYHHPEQGDTGYQFFMPSLNYMGKNSLVGASQQIKDLGLKKALIVTDAVLVKVGAIKALTSILDNIDVAYAIYDGVEPNPTIEQVDEGMAMVTSEKCDCIISFGGGSPHDAAKGIAVLATNGGSISDYEGVNKVPKKTMPLIAVNTTAGTASEMTRFAIITDHARKVKMAIIDWKVTPTISVDDPLLMLGMPKGLTAATGMDALTHAIEAYVSTASTPVTDACALHAIRLVSSYLRTAVLHGDNLEARDMMSYAEFLAGMAFNSASLGYVHAMAHQLGGFYNLPHGVCNAVLLPSVQEYNSKYVAELFIDIAQAMGITHVGEDKGKAVEKVLAGIRQLSKDVGIPANLNVLGVKPEDFDILATNAMKDACGLTNPKQPSKEEVIALYKQAYEQE